MNTNITFTGKNKTSASVQDNENKIFVNIISYEKMPLPVKAKYVCGVGGEGEGDLLTFVFILPKKIEKQKTRIV